jgi:hypothetical protein
MSKFTDKLIFHGRRRMVGEPIPFSVVVGESIWDIVAATRCKTFSVGV